MRHAALCKRRVTDQASERRLDAQDHSRVPGSWRIAMPWAQHGTAPGNRYVLERWVGGRWLAVSTHATHREALRRCRNLLSIMART